MGHSDVKYGASYFQKIWIAGPRNLEAEFQRYGVAWINSVGFLFSFCLPEGLGWKEESIFYYYLIYSFVFE
jgi:hypothetical protein